MQIKNYRVPLCIRINRLVMRPLFRSIFRVFGRVKMVGRENVPLGTPYAIAMNHISIFDPPFLVAFWPEAPEIVGAAEVFHKKGQGTLLSLYGVVPVHHGEYDRALLEKIVAILRLGCPLAIAPEGERSHVLAMQRAKPGVGYIIEHAGVPVIPVGILGTTGDFWQRARRGERPALEMRIGKPIHFPKIIEQGTERRAARQHNADLVMRHIAGLLPREYHGVYAGQAITPA
jgi:1-acyl-sn-glycerol-3-phosphate acyltransferase